MKIHIETYMQKLVKIISSLFSQREIKKLTPQSQYHHQKQLSGDMQHCPQQHKLKPGNKKRIMKSIFTFN